MSESNGLKIVRRTFTLQERVSCKIDEMAQSYKEQGVPMSASAMTNWMLAKQFGLVGDIEPMPQVGDDNAD